MSLAMLKSEREKFLADIHIGVLSVTDGDRGPLAVPVWYSYEPGESIVIVSYASAHKVALIRKAGRASLCVQSETLPYRYVSVEGRATLGGETNLRPIALRYLGEQMGEVYLERTAAERHKEIRITLEPKRWLSADYSKIDYLKASN
jgi:hypothetical protein